jgi:hypothetical protein
LDSIPLKQIVTRNIDIFGMRGEPVTRAEIVDEILREAPDEVWSFKDSQWAKRLAISEEVKSVMQTPLSKMVIEECRVKLPYEVAQALEKLPGWICISAGGGRNALHIWALKASPDHFLANVKLKRKKGEETIQQAQRSEEARNILLDAGVKCLEQLFALEAAQ